MVPTSTHGQTCQPSRFSRESPEFQCPSRKSPGATILTNFSRFPPGQQYCYTIRPSLGAVSGRTIITVTPRSQARQTEQKKKQKKKWRVRRESTHASIKMSGKENSHSSRAARRGRGMLPAHCVDPTFPSNTVAERIYHIYLFIEHTLHRLMVNLCNVCLFCFYFYLLSIHCIDCWLIYAMYAFLVLFLFIEHTLHRLMVHLCIFGFLFI